MMKKCLTLVLTSLLLTSSYAAVMGIDFGSQYYKAVVVQPGKPFSILENTSSQRKTENAIAFTNEERMFEKDAVRQSVRYPTTSMLYPLSVLGLEYSEDVVERLRSEQLLTNEFIKDERGLVGFQITVPDDKDLTNVDMLVEDILSMILEHAKKLAKQQAGEIVKDVTITVPSHFTMNQRLMVKEAAELAGFHVLSLVNENTAAALMYGIDTKDMQSPRTVLFVNMGASQLQLSLVEYSTVKSETGKELVSMKVLKEASAKNAGGHAFDVVLANIFARKFNEQPEREGKVRV